ncbi:MAG: DUF4194 domain-containing protein [Synergistaceae bacterium]|nr:DUF4194 domain-containing protein [Synergistaceae bacterium]
MSTEKNETGIFSYEEEKKLAFSRVLISLYKGVLFREESAVLWEDLLEMRTRVIEHFSVIGLQLLVDESEGYAFLFYPHEDMVDPEAGMPRLVAKRQLSFPVSLILALLRLRMAEFDAGGEGTRLIMSRDDIVEMVRVFMPEGSNDAKIVDKIDSHINKITELGFIRTLKDQPHLYEILRIIKAFINAQWLSDFDSKLASYSEFLKEKEQE